MFGFWGPAFKPDTDIPDLAGKVFLVTGGNTGLGRATVFELAKHNPRNIFLAARDRTKAEQTISDVKRIVPDANIAFLALDLGSFKSIRAAAETINASTDRLDVLMNNAGIMARPAALTEHGYEIQFGTNHLGHFLLTKLLLPLLEKTASRPNPDVRIINLTSGYHLYAPRGGILFDGSIDTTMESYLTWVRYGQSKLANILHVRELARRYPNIKCIAAHPGGVKTNLSTAFQENHPWIGKPGAFLEGFFLKTPAQGAQTQLWAATRPEAETGKYYVPTGRENAGSAYAQDAELARKLWDWSVQELSKHGY